MDGLVWYDGKKIIIDDNFVIGHVQPAHLRECIFCKKKTKDNIAIPIFIYPFNYEKLVYFLDDLAIEEGAMDKRSDYNTHFYDAHYQCFMGFLRRHLNEIKAEIAVTLAGKGLNTLG